MEQDTERRNWGGIPGAGFGVLWFVVYSTVFMNGNELMIRPSYYIVRPFDQCLQS